MYGLYLVMSTTKKLKNGCDMDQTAVLLAGASGIGMTTAGQQVWQDCGFGPIELSASDVHSKLGVQEVVETVTAANMVTQYLTIDNGRNRKERFLNGQVLFMEHMDGI